MIRRGLIAIVTVAAFHAGMACVNRSAPVPTPEPTRSQSCFGSSDFVLAPVNGVIAPPLDVERIVGVRVPVPMSIPPYAERLSSGIAATSIGNGRPAFVVEFHSNDPASPLGDIVYADRPVCELDPTPPAQTTYVQGYPLFIWTENLAVKYGARGVLKVDGTYVDITLGWTSYGVPDTDARVAFLRDWAERMVK